MTQAKPNVIFMGTPAFAVPALERLAGGGDITVSLVVTQPDRPAGRGKKVVSPAVKTAADRLGIPVLQTATLRDSEVRRQIVSLAPDLIVVAAFGMILGRWILELPRHGCVNLHASLLPAYRGANPIAAAIASGERETGVSLMRMERGLDTGPVYAMNAISITSDDTTDSLTPKLAGVAGELLAMHLAPLLAGDLVARAQGEGATLTRPMIKADGWLDFSRPAQELERQVRAMWSWPRAWSTSEDGQRMQVHAASVAESVDRDPGTVINEGGHVLVATGAGSLHLARVQFPGGRPVQGDAIATNKALRPGSVLGRVSRPEDPGPLIIPAPTAEGA